MILISFQKVTSAQKIYTMIEFLNESERASEREGGRVKTMFIAYQNLICKPNQTVSGVYKLMLNAFIYML